MAFAGVQKFVARQQRAHPRERGAIRAQRVLQRMPIGRQAGTRHARQQHERSRLGLGVPGANGVDHGHVPHEHGVQPFAQEPLGELGVAAAGAQEIRQGADHAGDFRLEQRLRAGREPHVLLVELAERVAPRFDLGDRRLGLAPRRARAHLLFLQRGDLAAGVMQRIDGVDRCLRVAGDPLRRRVGVVPGLERRGIAIGTLCGCQRQLLAQLAALAIQRGSFDFKRARGLGAALQRFFELSHRQPLGREAAPHVVLVAGARG